MCQTFIPFQQLNWLFIRFSCKTNTYTTGSVVKQEYNAWDSPHLWRFHLCTWTWARHHSGSTAPCWKPLWGEWSRRWHQCTLSRNSCTDRMQIGIFSIHLRERQLFSECDPFLHILICYRMSPAFLLSLFCAGWSIRSWSCWNGQWGWPGRCWFSGQRSLFRHHEERWVVLKKPATLELAAY